MKTKSDPEIPENLQIDIGSKDRAYWEEKLRDVEDAAIISRGNLQINEAVIELAKKRIAEEKEKFK